ncbi:nucleotidyl transferase AbiEii/AbiGii toxin family protein [Elusimicrobiota bacterium]
MIKPRVAADYTSEITSASFSVLLEVMTILKSYQDALVLIGGWVPYLLLRDHGPQLEGEDLMGGSFQHIGSIDIDLAVNHELVDDERYATIVGLLKDRKYDPNPEILYRLDRKITGISDAIGVDFLTSQPPPGKGKSHRHRKVQSGLRARATPDLEIAFKSCKTTKVEGQLPESGGRTTLDIKVADIPAIIALKGHALGERYKEKDAYDLYALARYYGRGAQEVIECLKPHLKEPCLKKALENIRGRFQSDKHTGPAWVANFFGVTDPAEMERINQTAFQAMDSVLQGCGY